MPAYVPSSIAAVAALGAALAAEILLGLLLSRRPPGSGARLAAWSLTAASVILIERLAAREAPGIRMIAVILALLYGMKTVVTVEEEERLSPVRWLGFALLWPGMRPAPFRSAGGRPLPGVAPLASRGAGALLLGAVLVGLAHVALVLASSRLLATVLLLSGLSLVLHFGLFTLAAAGWRAAGIDVGPLFRGPVRSQSLGEFWGRRWNLAFSEMTATAIFRPLVSLVGAPWALAISFVVSGLFHELAISLPVRAGYGRPLLYFALQGGLVLAERTVGPALARPGLAEVAQMKP